MRQQLARQILHPVEATGLVDAGFVGCKGDTPGRPCTVNSSGLLECFVEGVGQPFGLLK